MPGKKKKFIDKKNAVSFHLVHRSQRDPLQASEEASKHVLVQADTKEELAKRQEEQRKYGIFFEDQYDYMQHLKDVNEAFDLEPVDVKFTVLKDTEQHQQEPSIKLPSSVFASDVERDVGLLNQAVPLRGPQPDWDPDIVAGLDDDFDYDEPDNQLEDDFMVMANQPGSEVEEGTESGEEVDIASDEADFSDDPASDYGDNMFMDEETKSRFTNYSMSSSVIRRNEGLTLLDDRFEKIYEDYDESEIGALDHEEIDGSVQQGSEVLNCLVEEFEKQQSRVKLKDVVDEKEQDVAKEDDDSDVDRDLVKMVIEEPTEKWDCESILSTYSNLYNHPRLIEEPKQEKITLTTKLGIPADSLPSQHGLTQKQVEKEMLGSLRMDKASTYRPKGETAEERKDRKRAVKQERLERRQEKKSNKKAFSAEKVRQEKEVVNLKNNLQGIKMS